MYLEYKEKRLSMGKAVFDDDPANGMLLMGGNASGRTSANRINT